MSELRQRQQLDDASSDEPESPPRGSEVASVNSAAMNSVLATQLQQRLSEDDRLNETAPSTAPDHPRLGSDSSEVSCLTDGSEDFDDDDDDDDDDSENFRSNVASCVQGKMKAAPCSQLFSGLTLLWNPEKEPSQYADPSLQLEWHRHSEAPLDFGLAEFRPLRPIVRLSRDTGRLLVADCFSLTVRSRFLIKNSKKTPAGQRRQPGEAGTDELLVLRELSHPLVARLLHYFETKDNCFQLFPECQAVGQDALTWLCETEPTQIILIVCCIANATEYLYRNCIVHRDICAKSVLISYDGRPILFQFDYAEFFGSRAIRKEPSLLPEIVTRAPEVVSEELLRRCDPKHYCRCDVWGLAVLLGELLLGHGAMQKLLFRSKTDKHWVFSFSAIKDCKSRMPEPIYEILQLGLRRQPDRRPSISSLLTRELFAQHSATSLRSMLQLKLIVTKRPMEGGAD